MSSEILSALWAATEQQQFPAAALYIVATPIGNQADISIRALATLARVDVIACEDTRHSQPLLAQYGIRKPLLAAHEHNENAAAEMILTRLHSGERVALISDAGTPAISDPGARIVTQVRAAGFKVIPIPGSSAVVTALSAVGAEQGFSFLGFLPTKAGARTQMLAQWRHCTHDLVFYEAPHRLHESITALAEAFPERRLTIARELTKLHEQWQQIELKEAAQWLQTAPPARGEYVLIVHGVDNAADENADAADWQRILAVLLRDLPLKQAVALTVELSGAAKNAVYAHALSLKNQ